MSSHAHAPSSLIIQLDNIDLDFGSQSVLQNISLSVHSNKIMTVVGPNGAGKSSLIKIIAGLTKPTRGQVISSGKPVVGYVPQSLTLNEGMPLKVSRFLSLCKAPKHAIRDALVLVGAKHLWSKQVHTLSGGEMQRVLLARAISRSPTLLLLDEPLQGVDVVGQAELYSLISTIRDRIGCGIVMVSHDLHFVMAKTDSVICLNQHICCEGKPENVSQHPEYLNLFGSTPAENIAIYTHNHDHHHDLHGDAVQCGSECKHD